MSRSGLSDDCDDPWGFICFRGAVASAIRGRRGQAFLSELAAALDAMPVKELIAGELEADGCVCAIGSVGKARGIPMADIDPYDAERLAKTFDISEALVRELAYTNDECGRVDGADAERWKHVRGWVARRIKPSAEEVSP